MADSATDQLYILNRRYAYALEAQPTQTAYQTGQAFIFFAPTTASDVITVNIDGIGEMELHDSIGRMSGDSIEAQQLYLIVYDGTNFALLGGGSGRIDASGFDGNLDIDDDTVQEVAQKFDDYAPNAEDVAVDTANMGGLLSGTNANAQAMLEQLDDYVPVAGDVTLDTTNLGGPVSYTHLTLPTKA